MTNHTPENCDQRTPRGGVCPDCKKVLARRSSQHYAKANRAKVAETSKRYREANLEKTKLAVKRSIAKKPDYYKEQARVYRIEHVEQIKQYRLENIERDREYKRRWARENPQVGIESTARWRKNNPDKVKASDAKSRKKNHEKRLKDNHRWVENNSEHVTEYRKRYYEENKEKICALSREYAKAHPEKRREAQRRRNYRMTNSVDYEAVLKKFNMWCYLCNSNIASIRELHFDHVVPLSRGGEHIESNIRPTHANCNLRKSSKLLAELAQVFPNCLLFDASE